MFYNMVVFCYTFNMENSHEQKEIHPQYIFPDFRYEMGEIERTAQEFAPKNHQQFMKEFVEQGTKSQLTELSEEIWKDLENTDSYDISLGGWEEVADHADFIGRDWETKKRLMENGNPIHAPIILKKNGRYHKVAGNTRLMVARALGIRPTVVIVDMDDN